MTIARLLLDIGWCPFCGSSGYFSTEGCLRVGELVISSRGRRKGGQVGITFEAGGFAGGDGPKRGIRQEAADPVGMQGVAGLMGFDPRRKRETPPPESAHQIPGLVPAQVLWGTRTAVRYPP